MLCEQLLEMFEIFPNMGRLLRPEEASMDPGRLPQRIFFTKDGKTQRVEVNLMCPVTERLISQLKDYWCGLVSPCLVWLPFVIQGLAKQPMPP